MIRAKVIGAGGYGGVGITELLLQHPEVKLACLVAKNDVGMAMSTLYPHLLGFCELPILAPEDPAAEEPADITFFATPDGVAMASARAVVEQKGRVIDYSGDFRFPSAAAYKEYAQRIGRDPLHQAPELLADAVYGLPELHRTQIGTTTPVVGNAGCFAVSCILGLAPAVKYKLIEMDTIICDCKSGASGAGKKPSATFHFPSRYEQINAYRLGGHQHVMEIEQELSRLAGTDIAVTFTPQVIPACRGILSTLYAKLAEGVTRAKVTDAYEVFHKNNHFVRIFDREAAIGTMHVRGSNYCNLTIDIDDRTGTLRVVSHIDNLVKGQAGNAMQNMNLMFGFPEETGLDRPGQFP
jgi:N-acetyl-gamma-glutamyl-phosphate reductase